MALFTCLAAIGSTFPPAPPPSPPPLLHQQIEVMGYHGCWHTMAAIHAAKTLQRQGVVSEVVVRRAGSQHTPTFSDEDKATFVAFTANFPRTQHWDGQSPRIIVDKDPESAMGCSPFIQAYAEHFTGPDDFGLPPMRESLWRMALTEQALPLLCVAGLSKAAAFFSVDPPGKPLRGVARQHGRSTLLYDDIDSPSTVDYASHSLDRSHDDGLAALLTRVASQLGLDASEYDEHPPE